MGAIQKSLSILLEPLQLCCNVFVIRLFCTIFLRVQVVVVKCEAGAGWPPALAFMWPASNQMTQVQVEPALAFMVPASNQMTQVQVESALIRSLPLGFSLVFK